MDARSSIPRTSSLPTTKRLVRASFPAATADVPSEGRARMRSLGMVFAMLAAAGVVLSTSQILPRELAPLFTVTLLLATSLAVVAHVRAVPLRAALLWGLACEVLFALLVSVWGAWLGFERTGEIPEATWTCILIVTYPLIVPVPPRAMLVASSLAAATVPLGVAVIAGTSGEWPPVAKTATVVGLVAVAVGALDATTDADAVAVSAAAVSVWVVVGVSVGTLVAVALAVASLVASASAAAVSSAEGPACASPDRP